MNAATRYAPLLGRVLLAPLFLSAGYGKLVHLGPTVQYIASKGLPAPTLAALAATVIELGGGLLLIAGWKTRWAGAGLFLFTALTAVFFHAFWAAPADQAVNQSIHFWKNVSIMGGLLYVVAFGSGAFGLDNLEPGYPHHAARAGA